MEKQMFPIDFIAIEKNKKNNIFHHPELLKYYFSNEKMIKEIFQSIMKQMSFSTENNSLEYNLPNNLTKEQGHFLNELFSQISSFNQLLEYLQLIKPTKKAHLFFYYLLSLDIINFGIIIYAFSSMKNFENFFHRDYSYRWIEVGILKRAHILFLGAPSRQFTLEELIPMMLEDDGFHSLAINGVSRSIAGTAFDSSQLTNESIHRLLDIFPNDHYFLHCISDLNKI